MYIVNVYSGSNSCHKSSFYPMLKTKKYGWCGKRGKIKRNVIFILFSVKNNLLFMQGRGGFWANVDMYLNPQINMISELRWCRTSLSISCYCKQPCFQFILYQITCWHLQEKKTKKTNYFCCCENVGLWELTAAGLLLLPCWYFRTRDLTD